MKWLALEKNATFSNKEIIAFFIPIFFEQLMVSCLGIADTLMVSHLGETAVAGVALVNRIDNFAKRFFVALAQGGSVVLSQYIGAKDKELSEVSLKNNIRIVSFFGCAVAIIMLLFKSQIINLLFGNADADVLAVSNTYFSITALSYPAIALYNAGTATYRAMGESRIPFVAAISMMAINLVLKYIFIFIIDMGVVGAGLSTLLAMAIVGVVLLVMLKSHNNKVRLVGLFKLDFNKDIVSRIFRISIPNGIENGMFELGALLIAGLVSGLGTAAIAADQISRNLCPFVYTISVSLNSVIMVIVGQCMGAGRPDEAEMYTKHILKIDYLLEIINVIIFVAFLQPIISLFNVSLEAQSYTYRIMFMYAIGIITFYPLSFYIPSAMRGAGDTKFVMIISTASMFLFRIFAAYICVYKLNLGIVGVWVAMILDWVIRAFIFTARFINGKWKLKKVI